jgi:hypothetical protein
MSWTCPHCGNRDRSLMEDNGCAADATDLTLLCKRPCTPEDSTYSPGDLPVSAEWPADDPVRFTCGMQWEPNDPEGAS